MEPTVKQKTAIQLRAKKTYNEITRILTVIEILLIRGDTFENVGVKGAIFKSVEFQKWKFQYKVMKIESNKLYCYLEIFDEYENEILIVEYWQLDKKDRSGYYIWNELSFFCAYPRMEKFKNSVVNKNVEFQNISETKVYLQIELFQQFLKTIFESES